ncbi:family 43 glycosylhydrolase [Kushneria sp. Sum13]|uniref:family 43 glycosylhydrolase n=1 Tax=Kushneria sp. Sum13 TaxID=3459196 RepID=UPI0040453843
MKGLIRITTSLLLGPGLLSTAHAEQVEVHDPVMARDNGTYYVFSTGPGIDIYSSRDLTHWRHADRVFSGEPSDPPWATSVAPGFDGHVWAPDIVEKNGRYYLYYSVSAFGKNTSGIGVTVNDTLDPAADNYQWRDQGLVLQSEPGRDNWNAIDPAVIEDDNGTAWMSFGSFWGGLKLVQLAEDMTHLAQPETVIDLATRPNTEENPIEAPFIFKRSGHYYLFASFGFCCRGVDSTYRLVVGRSDNVQGPYIDRDGVPMMEGGGTPVLSGTDNWPGLGHNGVYTFDGQDVMVFHAYEAADDGVQKLRIVNVDWDDGWPVVDPAALDANTTELVESP